MVPSVYYNNDKQSFAFATCQKRWPILIQNAIDDITFESKSKDSDAQAQGLQILEGLKLLLEELQTDQVVKPFESNLPGLDSYNNTLSELPQFTWLTGPWLFTECYLYRRIDECVKSQPLWLQFDIFEKAKRDTFKSSSFGIYELAIRYQELYSQVQSAKKLDLATLKLLFTEFIDISLWGNATDLSLLANATLEDIKSVQGAELRKKSEQNILSNDLPRAWDQLCNSTTKRVDFILDNAGFENYTDLILTLFLLDTGLANEVIFHCKSRPWMVSDTMCKDFDILLKDMANTEWFPDHRESMDFVVERLTHYHGNGKLKMIDNEFWTIDLDYWNISPSETKFGGAELYHDLIKSDLIIVKGDLNYRKLTGDRKWPRSTPFIDGIGPLSSNGLKILLLRTCKADVCLGLAPGKDEELSKYWREQGNEVGELWCSSGKWAVISYTSGHDL